MSSQRKKAILYLDIEGGFGGSSRSLFYLIEALDRERFVPIVLSRQPGPVQERYSRLGVNHEVFHLPAFRPAVRNNWIAFGMFLLEHMRVSGLKRLLEHFVEEKGLALVHVNHEGLALLGRWISRKFGLPWICHIRTRMHPSFWSRYVYRTIDDYADRVVFITENEEQHFARVLNGTWHREKGVVIHNSLGSFFPGVEPMPEFTKPADAFRVISLSNFSRNRGADQVVRVAHALRKRGREDFTFFLCGRPASKRLRPWTRDKFFADLVQEIRNLHLEQMVRLPGYVDYPERALVGCHALVQTRRRACPWGREIMEAMACGLPVVAVGRYQGFVEHGVNGFLVDTFDPEAIADHLMELKDNPSLLGFMSEANKAKASRMFDGRRAAARVEEIYLEVLDR
jgi:glycosyltransferase involved in cell wall biosynthesis